MIKIYVRAVLDNRITVEQIPKRWRDEVIAILSKTEGETNEEK